MNSYKVKSWLMQLLATFLIFIASTYIFVLFNSLRNEYVFLWFAFNITQPIFIHSIFRRNRRLKFLTSTFGEEEGRKIYKGVFWIGMPCEALKYIWGEPLAIDKKINKSKVVEIWKYDRVTKKHYGTKFTIENGKLTGWDLKDR